MAVHRPFILRGSRIWSPGVRSHGEMRSIAVRDGIIDLVEREGPDPVRGDYQLLDIPGVTVIPGLIDCHVHLTQTGLDLMSVDLRDCGSMEEVIHRLRSGPALGPVIQGVGFDPEDIPQGRWPSPEEMDDLPGPVILSHAEIHASMVNRECLRILGLEGPPRVLLGWENAGIRRRLSCILDDSLRKRGLDLVCQAALSRGVTTVHALEGGHLFGDADLDHMLEAAGHLPLETVIYPQVESPERAFQLGLGRMGGCLLLDGSPGVQTAALFEDYPGRPGYRGELYLTQEEVNGLVDRAHNLGLQISLHATGEAAIEQALQAFSRVGPAFPPHRLEHFEIPAPGQARRAAQAGVVLSVQPSFDLMWSREYLDTVGPVRGLRANPLASCLREGAHLAGGSDSGVTPLDPMLGIRAALSHSREEERLDLEEAFSLYTLWAAAAGGTLDRGRLRPGTRADLVFLEEDPRESDRSLDLEILGTMVGGEFRFMAPRLAGKGFDPGTAEGGH